MMWEFFVHYSASYVIVMLVISPGMLCILYRLTFWLSNSIMLRAIVSQAVREISLIGPRNKSSGGGNGSDGRSLRKWDKSSPSVEDKSKSREEFDDWEDPITFTIALEKVEAWIFSRIVESVWWQVVC